MADSKLKWKFKIKGKSLPKQPITIHIRKGEQEPDADDYGKQHVARPRASSASIAPGY